MVILDQFYHLVEQNHVIISNIWKILPLAFITTAAVCGIVYAYLIGQFIARFSKRCVFFSLFYLHPKVKPFNGDTVAIQNNLNDTHGVFTFYEASRTTNNNHTISQRFVNNLVMAANTDYYDNNASSLPILTIDINDYEHGYYLINNTKNGTLIRSRSIVDLPSIIDIKWSEHDTCDYLQFTPLFCSMIGITVLALFVMFGKGGNSAKNGLRSPWRIVMPSLIATTTFSVLTVLTLRYSNKGIYVFCKDFVETYGWMSCSEILNTVSYRIESDILDRMLKNDAYSHRHGLTRLPNGSYVVATNTKSDLMNYNHTHKRLRRNSNRMNILTTHELYYVSELFLGIAMSAWILCALFLIIRIVTIVDFQLIQVTVRTVEPGNIEDGQQFEDTEEVTESNTSAITLFSDEDESKNVTFKQPELETIFDRQNTEDEEDTEVEIIIHSPDPESNVILASPESFDDTEDSTYELINLNPTVPPKTKKFHKP